MRKRKKTIAEMRESCAKLGDMMADAVGLPEVQRSLKEALDILRFLRKHGREPDPPTGGLIDLEQLRQAKAKGGGR